ncbi:hypothetical protein Droror1_Dr00012759 [Drosera rotundifolia]
MSSETTTFPDADNQTVKDLLESYFRYKQSFLGAVIALIFAYSIGHFNCNAKMIKLGNSRPRRLVASSCLTIEQAEPGIVFGVCIKEDIGFFVFGISFHMHCNFLVGFY